MHARAEQRRLYRRFIAKHVGHLQLDVIRDFCVPPAQLLRGDLGETRVIDEPVRLAADVHAGAVVVRPHAGVIDRADDGHVVHDLRELRQQFADMHARHAGRNRPIRPAGWCPRFRVPGFELTGAASQIEDNDGLRLLFQFSGLGRLHQDVVRQQRRPAEETGAKGAEKMTASQAVSGRVAVAIAVT